MTFPIPLRPPRPTPAAPAPQTLERPLRPGENSLEDLERAFRETPVDPPPAKPVKLAPVESPVSDDDSAKADAILGGFGATEA